MNTLFNCNWLMVPIVAVVGAGCIGDRVTPIASRAVLPDSHYVVLLHGPTTTDEFYYSIEGPNGEHIFNILGTVALKGPISTVVVRNEGQVFRVNWNAGKESAFVEIDLANKLILRDSAGSKKSAFQ